MSDGIFDGIFPVVHRTFLLSCFRGCWRLDFFVLEVCGHIMKRLSSLQAAAVFFKRLQQHGHEFRDETKLLAKETL